ncbi:MAG: hypothetical protein LLG00_13090 [Planctomycetaceae bacterium]|nr:hypothetical protein [Planctomycetaceae bacterium]
MSRPTSLFFWSIAVLTLACAGADGQDVTSDAPAAKKAAQKPVSARPRYRLLVPGVMQSVDPMRALEESVSRHDVVELLAADPKLDWAKDIPFRRDIWALSLQFKPVRMIEVDMPQPSGMMQRKTIWYMVYSVTNTGKVMHPTNDAQLGYDTFEKKPLYQVQMVDRAVRFAPEFLLEGRQHMDKTGFTKLYPDRVIPVAMVAIRHREDPQRKFLSTVDMCREIAVGETLWGIATWEDIDPRVVRFSVYVSGLTNAYRWKDVPGEHKKGEAASGRRLYRKTLELNFWRPGDPFYEHEEEIRYGIPGGVDYRWVYR